MSHLTLRPSIADPEAQRQARGRSVRDDSLSKSVLAAQAKRRGDLAGALASSEPESGSRAESRPATALASLRNLGSSLGNLGSSVRDRALHAAILGTLVAPLFAASPPAQAEMQNAPIEEASKDQRPKLYPIELAPQMAIDHARKRVLPDQPLAPGLPVEAQLHEHDPKKDDWLVTHVSEERRRYGFEQNGEIHEPGPNVRFEFANSELMKAIRAGREVVLVAAPPTMPSMRRDGSGLPPSDMATLVGQNAALHPSVPVFVGATQGDFVRWFLKNGKIQAMVSEGFDTSPDLQKLKIGPRAVLLFKDGKVAMRVDLASSKLTPEDRKMIDELFASVKHGG